MDEQDVHAGYLLQITITWVKPEDVGTFLVKEMSEDPDIEDCAHHYMVNTEYGIPEDEINDRVAQFRDAVEDVAPRSAEEEPMWDQTQSS